MQNRFNQSILESINALFSQRWRNFGILLLLLVSISFLLFSFTGWLEFQKVIEKEDEK